MTDELGTIVPLSKNDPHSFSNPDLVYAEKMDIFWDIDFPNKLIRGTVKYYLMKRDLNVSHIIFDTQGLTILSVTNRKERPLEYTMCEPVPPFGVPMRIKLSLADKTRKSFVRIDYETSGSTSVQWVPSTHTYKGTFPYMYNQGQAINNRSLLPCQDTPATKAAYYAEVTVPKDFTVVMSGIRVGGGPRTVYRTHKVFSFEQNIVIPSYLIAIAVANFAWLDIGPRTRVFAEEGLTADAAYEFGETEFLLKVAERMCGDYVWGPYDILVLPPMFPYGAMENPCVTFVTPTILAGDRSLAHTIAHEIAHSWSGNLVTCKNFEHFWLNEGLTMYLERKIIGTLHGEKYRQLLSLNGWKILKDEVHNLGPFNGLTCLVQDLHGIHPEEGFNQIPYEKGYVFIYYLAQLVGGSGIFIQYLQHYIDAYRYKSVDSNTFKFHFIAYFQENGMAEQIEDIDWDTWFYGPGMPPWTPNYDTTLATPCLELRNRWVHWDPNDPNQAGAFNGDDLKEFRVRTTQMEEFLALFLEDEQSFPLEKVKAMQDVYHMNSITNCEIRYRWYRLCIKARWKQQLQLIAQFLTQQGRVAFNQPLYRALYEWEEMRPLAIELFHKAAPAMMPVIVDTIARELHIERKK